MTPFDIINTINNKSEHDKTEIVESYSPFVINRGLSMHRDTVLFANEMNRCYSLDKDQQFDFYYNAIPKGKRYGKWAKAEAEELEITNIMSLFVINRKQAEEYRRLFSSEQIKELNDNMIKGGRHGRK